MNKSMKAIMFIVMLSAVALMVICSLHYLSLGRELRSCEQQLAESRAKWESIAAEKEALQEDLKASQKELNIARLELDKATEDAEEIKAEIDRLKSDILLLQSGSSGE